jgi:LDH2 family malate/lactate/ureidoglycolate dehydrogenase
LEAYYAAIAQVDGQIVQDAVNRAAPRSTYRLGAMLSVFSRERFLSDYAEDAKLMVRLNQVMRRTRLAPLPEGFCQVLAPARRLVAERQAELLDGIPVAEENQ